MKVFRSRLPIPLLAAMALFCCAAAANANIRPFQSIAGFELGIDEGKVREQIGEPTSVQEGPVVGQRTLVYRRHKLEFKAVPDGRIITITTRSRAHRTSNDLGVGTTMKTLRAKLRGEHCSEVRAYTNCAVVRAKKTMEYIVVRDRVKSVSLSD
jgi:hypothetical protein